MLITGHVRPGTVRSIKMSDKKYGYSEDQKKKYKDLSKGIFNRGRKDDDEDKPKKKKKDGLQKLRDLFK